MTANVDLGIEFTGIKFKNPFILASAPPSATGEMMERAFKAGWAGAVTKTLVLDSVSAINATPRLNTVAFQGKSKKIYGMHNIELVSDRPLSVYLKEVEGLRKKFPENVIAASIMAEANNKNDWRKLAILCESAGAQALELNFSCPHKAMPGKTVGSAIGHDPDITRIITSWVKEVVKIPVWVKLTPNITDISIPGNAAKQAKADALVAINSVLCLSGIDLDTFIPKPSVNGSSSFGGYSGPAIKPIALRIVAELASKVKLPVSGIGGITTWQDGAEFLLVGASLLQVCSAVMFSGYDIIKNLTGGLANYMEEKGFKSVKDMVGLALPRLKDIDELSKDYRVIAAVNESLCIKCGSCHIACRDGGFQAIELNQNRVPVIKEDRCKGCSLCVQVCPVENCITMEKVRQKQL